MAKHRKVPKIVPAEKLNNTEEYEVERCRRTKSEWTTLPRDFDGIQKPQARGGGGVFRMTEKFCLSLPPTT